MCHSAKHIAKVLKTNKSANFIFKNVIRGDNLNLLPLALQTKEGILLSALGNKVRENYSFTIAGISLNKNSYL